MGDKPKPVTREELQKLAVTDVDAFGCLRYLREREVVPAIPELEKKGENQLPGIEGSLLDLYHSLWSPEPVVRDAVPPARKYWAGLLGQALTSSAYEELHGATQLSELKSVLGTVAMGESVLALVPEEDKTQLQELHKAQQAADAAQKQASEMEAQADIAQMLADAAAAGSSAGQGVGKAAGRPGAGQASPSAEAPSGAMASGQQSGGRPQGGGMTPEEAQARANELAEAAAQAKAEAKKARANADESQLAAEILAEELLGQPGSAKAEEKLRELARIGLQAMRDAQKKVSEVSETIQAWGLEEGELHRKGIPEALGLLERMRRNVAFQKFAALLGRIRQIAARKARSKIAGEGVRIATVETGRDLKRALPCELVALSSSVPALRVKALMRWAQGELRLAGQQVRRKLGHGPVVVCEDASGSMEGAKQQWAKAVTLALAHYARLQRRSFGWIMFDSSVRLSRTYPQGRLSAEQMLELAEARAGGGTDFETPLKKAFEMIRAEGLKKADIAFITDGDCAVSDKFLSWLREEKKALEVTIVAVLCDAGHSADRTVRMFADRIETASAFTAEEAERKVFGHF